MYERCVSAPLWSAWRFPWWSCRPSWWTCRPSWRSPRWLPWWSAWFPRRASWTPRRSSRRSPWRPPRRLGTRLGLGARRSCGWLCYGGYLGSCPDSSRTCVYAACVYDSRVHGARIHYGCHACGAAGGGSRPTAGGGSRPTAGGCSLHAAGGGSCAGSRRLPLVVSLWLPARGFFGKLTPNNTQELCL